MDDSLILQALHTVVDPGLGESIVDLGWISRLRRLSDGRVALELTPPTPHYPNTDTVARRAREAIQAAAGIEHVDVTLTWSPPWTPNRMASQLKAALGLPDDELIDGMPSPVQPSAGLRSRLGRLFGR